MKQNNKEQKDSVQKVPYIHTSPHDLSCTKKQQEVLELLNKGMGLSKIARYLNLLKSSIQGRLRGLEKKELVKHEFYTWTLTKAGKLQAEKSTVSSTIIAQKNVHQNQFSVDVKKIPQLFCVECLGAKNYFYNQFSKNWVLEFEDCKIVLSKDKATFFINMVVGKSFDECQNNAWDSFVGYYKLICDKGVSLDNTVSSKNPEFANPDGFFARLSSFCNNKGFRIENDKGIEFWVDFSQGTLIPEEETNDGDVARRMERLADSAMTSDSDFNDLDKIKEVLGTLVKLEAMKCRSSLKELEKEKGAIVPITRPDYFG